ncbi:MAG TPA: tRNA (N6-threonylcarbamoyladenosine(37)-N6)-methyltransferase TrmO [Dehalococcoidia bacterium]|nr:tRNA (N6-threonylcarbamoyladenosine(37)-N6)-methyltransferase TrmO [Dehalococcoidia bacterium]
MNQAEKGQATMTLEPIAVVRNEIKEMGKHKWEKVVSLLIFSPDLEEALDGLEKFSHIIVVFWMHLSPVKEYLALKIHPQMRPDLPLVGVLATRSPVRPNPLGVTIVKLLERKGSLLKVVGLDALDGTPVVDIKPYLPGDSIINIKAPRWVYKLRQEDSE